MRRILTFPSAPALRLPTYPLFTHVQFLPPSFPLTSKSVHLHPVPLESQPGIRLTRMKTSPPLAQALTPKLETCTCTQIEPQIVTISGYLT